MPKRRHISASDRKRIAAVRLQGLAVAGVYQGRLARLRRAELRRVLSLCKQLDDPEDVPLVLEQEIREDYLMGWWQKLWMTAGPPAARDTAQELRQAKAAAEDNIWLQALRAYATQRAGENIVSVTGTWRESLVNLTRTLLGDDIGIGVEKLTQRIFAGYTGALQEWQCRRIAQTEALIGMAEAGNLATQQLGVAFTKQWCTSGLPNVRESHQDVDGLEIDEDEPFELPGGLLMYPHDTHLGADASEIINCACACIRRPKGNLDTVTQQQPDPEEARIQSFMSDMDPQWSEKLRRAKAENYLEIEKGLGIKKGAFMTIEDADKDHANPDWGKGRPNQVNCATCVPTYALRKQGFDVTAKPCVEGSGSLMDRVSNDPWLCWKNADGTKVKPNTFMEWMQARGYKSMTSDRYSEFFEEFCKDPGDYELVLNWKKGGGHATVISRLADGSLVGIEPQKYWEWRGVTFKLDFTISTMKANPDFRCGIMRLDDKIIDPKWVGLFNVKK